MNRNILIALVFGWVLAGCAGASPLPDNTAMFGSTGTISVPGCSSFTDTASCSGDNEKPKVIVDLDNSDVAPKCVKARKGRVIHITLVSASPIGEGTVVVFPKDPGNYPWLVGTNKPNAKKIKIKVPKDKPIGEYEYGIWTAAKCIDPRVKVEL